MTAVQVGRDFLNLPTDIFETEDNRNGAIIDSGTTLAYLPELIYEPLVTKVVMQKNFCVKDLNVKLLSRI